MDGQRPRDLFDVMHLFEHGGITPGIRRAFVVYLASHNRALHEVLFPPREDVARSPQRAHQAVTENGHSKSARLRSAREKRLASPPEHASFYGTPTTTSADGAPRPALVTARSRTAYAPAGTPGSTIDGDVPICSVPRFAKPTPVPASRTARIIWTMMTVSKSISRQEEA